MRLKQFLEQNNGGPAPVNGNGSNGNGMPNGNGDPIPTNGNHKNNKMKTFLVGLGRRFSYSKRKCPKGFKWSKEKGRCIKK